MAQKFLLWPAKLRANWGIFIGPTKAKNGGFPLVQDCIRFGLKRLVQVIAKWFISIGPNGVISYQESNKWLRSNLNPN